MPRYYIDIVHRDTKLIRKRIIEHSNIDYFEDRLNEHGFLIKQINKIAADVSLEDISTIDPAPPINNKALFPELEKSLGCSDVEQI